MNEPHPAVLGMIQGLKVDIKYQGCHFCLWHPFCGRHYWRVIAHWALGGIPTLEHSGSLLARFRRDIAAQANVCVQDAC
jgi:hypothetical protein